MEAFTDLRSREGSFLHQQHLVMCFYMVEGNVGPESYWKATNTRLLPFPSIRPSNDPFLTTVRSLVQIRKSEGSKNTHLAVHTHLNVFSDLGDLRNMAKAFMFDYLTIIDLYHSIKAASLLSRAMLSHL